MQSWFMMAQVAEAGDVLPPLITIMLLVVLIWRQLINGLENAHVKRLHNVLTAISLPLLVVFSATVAIRIVELMQRYNK